MPYDEGLPQTGDSQDIGQDAIDCLRANRPKNCKLTPLAGDEDYGFDFQVQITTEQQVVHPFHLQLKGTTSPKKSADGSYLSIALSTSTLRYFANADEPVLLAICDLSVDPEDPRNCPVYYVWIHEELERIELDRIPLSQKEVTLRVPTSNALTRSTNLFTEVRTRHRLANIGRALDTRVAGIAPEMGDSDRMVMLEAITENISARNIDFAQALAEPARDIWINPPRGSLAWLLTESKNRLESGSVTKSAELLRQATEKLDQATTLERAEYWYLSGRLHTVEGADDDAAEAFKNAAGAESKPKYWAAWAESELRKRYQLDGTEDYSDIIAALPAEPEPLLLSIKARLLAASRKYEEAIALLDSFSGVESLASRAIVQTMFSKHEEALQACLSGLEIEDARESTRILFLILRARARFNIALKNSSSSQATGEDDNEMLPPSGPIGVNATALRAAWTDIEEAASALEDIDWVTNAEFAVDMWIATASMLGKQQEILGRVLAAARARPRSAELQNAAESIAAQCGDFVGALAANSRLPDTDTKVLRRIAFLHELGKHGNCVDLMSSRIDSLSRSHPFFGPAVTSAALSADAMAREDLVETWRSLLANCGGELRAHAAVLDHVLFRRRNRLLSDDPTAELTRIDAELGHPMPTTLLLFQELDPGSTRQAQQFLEVTGRLRSRMRLSPLIALHMATGLATLGRWNDLVELCDEAEKEFDTTERLKAFRALALDRVGRSDEAREMLERMLEGGIEDSLALNTYVNIMIRCGLVLEAKAVAEKILERAQTKQRKTECIRMLFNLEQNVDPGSPRLVDLAFKMGSLADPNNEIEEGVFISMMTASGFGSSAMTKERQIEFQKRANAYFEKFPDSKVIWRIEIPHASTGDDLLRTLKSSVGLTEEQENAQAHLEEELQKGKFLIPYAWRPKFALANVQDIAQLWELGKRAGPEDRKYHLNMIGPHWRPRKSEEFRSQTPLLDLITLFVLRDLDLLDDLFLFFPKIAISQETLGELMNMAQVFSGSMWRDKCIALQEQLRPHLAKIHQPRSNFSENEDRVPRASREIRNLVGSGDYLLYSDDFIFQIWCTEGKSPRVGMCTLDFLCGLEEMGRLSTAQVRSKLVQLFAWHVGIRLPPNHQISLMPEEVGRAIDVVTGVNLLRGSSEFMSIADAMWSGYLDSTNSVGHIGAAIREFVLHVGYSTVAISSFTAIWLEKTKTREDMTVSGLSVAASAVLCSVLPEKLPIEAARRLWKVYFDLVRFELGSPDGNDSRRAVALLAAQAADLDRLTVGKRHKDSFGERLMTGLRVNSETWFIFAQTYVQRVQ